MEYYHGISFDPMFGSSNVYERSQFSRGTHFFEGFPFPRGSHPVGFPFFPPQVNLIRSFYLFNPTNLSLFESELAISKNPKHEFVQVYSQGKFACIYIHSPKNLSK